jgi:hypothetical protein
MMTHRTLIVPLAHVPLADALCSALAGPAGSGMFITGLSATGSDPVTHYISSGVISDEMAALLPLTTVNPDGSTTTAPGDPAYVVELAAQAGITVTVEQVAGLLASVDVSDQAPFDAMARLGLKLVQRPLP